MRIALTLLVAALMLPGCVSEPVTDADGVGAADALADAAAPSPLGLAGTSCMEGGGHSVHPKSLWASGQVRVVPDPWVPADVLDDVGPQLTFSEIPDPERPIPENGNTMGNYHATMWCDAWTLDGAPRDDVFLGFVGMKVEDPRWFGDAGGAAQPTHQYVVTVVASNDDEVLARLHAGGIAAMKATATRDELPDGTLRIRMFTEGNGAYDSLFKPKADGDMHATHVRLWWQMPLDDAGHEHGHDDGPHMEGAFRPVALDLFAQGGAHAVAEAQGYFSHTGTQHHEPLPGAYGHTAAVLYTGFDRVVEWGPRVGDVTLDWAYVH